MEENEKTEGRRRKRIRRYQSVTDRVSRRIYRLDRWRIPWAGGVAAISLAYVVGWFVAVAILSRVPVSGHLLGLLPPSIVWVAIPLLGSWALTTLRIDGRAPHRALLGASLWALRPRTLAALRPCPDEGSDFAPLDFLVVAPSGDEPRYRRGRVRGPATLTLRYPAQVSPHYRWGVRLRRAIETRLRPEAREAWERPEHRLAKAAGLRVRAVPAEARPLRRAGALRVPPGREVTFE